MKIFVGGEPLREQLRTAHGPILIDNQTAIGFVVKEHLRDSKDDERIKSAANDCQDQRGEDCAANFRKECLHNRLLKTSVIDSESNCLSLTPGFSLVIRRR